MDKLETCQILHSTGNLEGYVLQLRWCDLCLAGGSGDNLRVALKELVQVSSLGVLHHDEGRVAVADSQQTQDVGVFDVGHELHLLVKDLSLGLGRIRLQLLHCHKDRDVWVVICFAQTHSLQTQTISVGEHHFSKLPSSQFIFLRDVPTGNLCRILVAFRESRGQWVNRAQKLRIIASIFLSVASKIRRINRLIVNAYISADCVSRYSCRSDNLVGTAGISLT